MWMKGAGCITEGSLNIQQAKKAGDLVSEVSKVLRLLSGFYSKAYAHLFNYIMRSRKGIPNTENLRNGGTDGHCLGTIQFRKSWARG